MAQLLNVQYFQEVQYCGAYTIASTILVSLYFQQCEIMQSMLITMCFMNQLTLALCRFHALAERAEHLLPYTSSPTRTTLQFILHKVYTE